MSTSNNSISYLSVVDQILRTAIERTTPKHYEAWTILWAMWKELVNNTQLNSDELYIES